MSSHPTEKDVTVPIGIILAGAAAGALAAYYLASRPAARRVAWQAVKMTLTTSLPAIVLEELQPRSGDGASIPAPASVLED